MSIRKFITTLLAVILLPMASFAQKTIEQSESVRIYFKQGSSVVEQSYMNNGEELVRLAALLEAYMQENAMDKGAISIQASASPEGTTQINTRLVNARAQALVDLLGKKVNGKIGYEISFVGIDWASLIEKVEANANVPYRDEVLDILKNTPETITLNGKTVNERNRKLESLRGGVPYRWLLKNIYPSLRYAAVRSDVVYTLELRVVNEGPIVVEADGGQGEILFEKSVKDNVAPKVTTNAKWLTKIVATPEKVAFVAQPNTIAESRSAKVALDYYGTIHEVVVEQKAAQPSITFPSGQTVVVKALGGENTTSYVTNVPNAEKPVVVSDAEWVKNITVEDGNITYIVEPNTSAEPRAAALQVSSYGNTEYVIIRQHKATPDMIIASADGSVANIEMRESVMIYFRQGSAVMDRSYMNNAENLDRLAELLESYILDDEKAKGRVRINASASPEGTTQINTRLVNARAKAISDWISRKFNKRIGYEIDFKGIDWTLLLALVEAEESVPYKDEVVNIIKNTPDQVVRKGVVINERERQIEKLHGGEAYRWLLTNIYPRLRYAAVETYVMYAREINITSDSQVRYPAEGAEGVITFEKNVNDKVVPHVHNEASWIKNVTPSTSDVTYTVEPNLIAEPRFSVISVEAYGVEHNILVNQDAAEPALTITSEKSVKSGVEGGQNKATYTTNVPNNTTKPVVTSDADWISDIKEEEDGTITYTVAPNEVAESRKAVVKVECFGKEQEIVVEQEAAEPVLTITSETPVNMPAEGGEGRVTYVTNVPNAVPANVTTEAEWIDSIAVSTRDFTFLAEANKSRDARTDTLVVESYGKSAEVVVNQEPSACTFPLFMSASTNLLYDLLITPNIGAEIYLGGNFSLDANWHYAWWKNDNKAFYWRTYGGDASLRWWFGKEAQLKPLTGHHIGVYGQMITYDFEFGKKGVLADRWSWSTGLEYGYSLPIAERMNLDFTLGVGYHWGEFYEYLPIDGHYVWQATKRRQYIGPTKCEVSLVWLLGCNNYNKVKGGKR